MSFFSSRNALLEARSVMLFAAMSLGASAAALAQSTVPATNQDPAAVFAKTDKNGDKKLSAEEAKSLPAISEQFSKIDADGDGSISEAEFMKAMQGS